MKIEFIPQQLLRLVSAYVSYATENNTLRSDSSADSKSRGLLRSRSPLASRSRRSESARDTGIDIASSDDDPV